MVDEKNSNLFVKQTLRSQPTSHLSLIRKCDIPVNGTGSVIAKANSLRGKSPIFMSDRPKSAVSASLQAPRPAVPPRTALLKREAPKIDLAPPSKLITNAAPFPSTLRPKPSPSAFPPRKEAGAQPKHGTSIASNSSIVRKAPTNLSRTWTPTIRPESTSATATTRKTGASLNGNGRVQNSLTRSLGCDSSSAPTIKSRPLVRQTRPATAATFSTGRGDFADRLGAKKKTPSLTLDPPVHSKLSNIAKVETSSLEAAGGPPTSFLTGAPKPRPLCRPARPFPPHETLSELTRFSSNGGKSHVSLLTSRLHLRAESLVKKSRTNSRQVSSSLISSTPSSPNPRKQSDEQSTAWRGRGLVADEDIMPSRTARRERSILESPEPLPSFLGPDDLLIENLRSPSSVSAESTRSPELLSSKDIVSSESATLECKKLRPESISHPTEKSGFDKPRKATVIHSPEVSWDASSTDRKTTDQPESSNKGLVDGRLSKVRTPNTLVVGQTPYTSGYSISKRFNVFKTPQKNLNFSAIHGSSRHACGSLSQFNRSPLRKPAGSLLTTAIVMGNELVVEKVILKSDEEINGLLTIPCKYRRFFKLSAEAESADNTNLAWCRLYSPPITLAAKLGKARVVKKLVELGAETTRLDGGGRSLLHSLFLPLPEDILACRGSGDDPLPADQYPPELGKQLQHPTESFQPRNDLPRRVVAPLDLSMSTPIVPSHTRSSSPTCLTWATPFGSNGRYSLVTPRIAFLDKKEPDKLDPHRVSLCETLLAPDSDNISVLDDMSRIVEALCSSGISLELVDRNCQVATTYARKWLHQAAHELQDTSRVTLRQQLAASAVRAAALTLLAHEDRLRSSLLAPLFTSFPIKGFSKLVSLTSQGEGISGGSKAEQSRPRNKPSHYLKLSKNRTAARSGGSASAVRRARDEDLTQLIQLAHKNSGNAAFLCIWEFLGASFVDVKP